jgi:hypothetical protein
MHLESQSLHEMQEFSVARSHVQNLSGRESRVLQDGANASAIEDAQHPSRTGDRREPLALSA